MFLRMKDGKQHGFKGYFLGLFHVDIKSKMINTLFKELDGSPFIETKFSNILGNKCSIFYVKKLISPFSICKRLWFH